MATLLIIDDDPAFRSSLSEMLSDLGHQVIEASHVQAGLQCLRTSPLDLVITDLKLAGEDGLSFLRQAQAIKAVPCIMLTAYASGSNTIEAMRLGAFDHLTKPVSRQLLMETLQRALPERTEELIAESVLSADTAATERLIGNSECMRQVFKQIGLAAATEATVLILGETGTGKEEVARALHRNSLHADGPFVVVNCAAIPPELMESELFGHVKGAFTGAVADRKGYLRQAEGGTLFLDEIGDMPLALQAKILRVLEAREFSQVGAQTVLILNARIIAATHRDLPAAVRAGQFREDLWYRLQVMPIMLPPLRARG
ncbi:MAG TPA: sigma-54 dependent transcriptional regulator, partial [Methylophilus sp.]